MSRVIMVVLPCCPLGYLPSMNFIVESLCTRELLLPLRHVDDIWYICMSGQEAVYIYWPDRL